LKHASPLPCFFPPGTLEPGCVYEKTMAEQGLVEVQQAIPGILVQRKYATSDNFMHKNVYGCLQKAYLQKEVVARLKKAQDYLSANHPGYHFLIYDATRPLAKQWDLWNALPQYSPKLRSDYVAKSGGTHPRVIVGSAGGFDGAQMNKDGLWRREPL
jgi:D-alanyl-D-alanine dipeptidase